jgi:TolB-like protein
MLSKRPVDRPRDGAEVLQALLALAPDGTADASAPARVRRRRSRVSRAMLLAAGVAAVSLAAAGGWRALRAGRHPASVSAPVALAVLPLANLSGDPAQEYFSDGITEEITGKLSRLGGLAVTARSTAARYKGSPKDAREIGGELGVAYVVEGSVRRAGDRIRVSATLVNAADARQVWSETIEARLDDVFDVQERVATRIVEALDLRLSADEAGSFRSWGTRSAQAYDAYLRGQALVERHNRRENVDAARGYYERALALDPDFAAAMVGLALAEATTYRNFDSDPARLARARALLARALALDPKVPQASAASGILRAVTWDYRGAAEEFRRATVLEPRNPLWWDSLCFVLGYVVPPEAPVLDEAERACRRALALGPTSVEALYHLTRILALTGRIEEAEQAVGRIAELSPRSNYVFSGRYWIYLYSGRPRQALDALSEADVVNWTGLNMAWKATALAQAGDLGASLAVLDQALAAGYRDVAQLRHDPMLDPLRRDRRFEPLLSRYGIPR